MASILSHAVAAIALKSAFPAPRVPIRLLLLGAAFSMAPDADVMSFQLGIPYGDLFGHRGFTHSFLFAGLLALFGTFAACPRRGAGTHPGLVWLYLSSPPPLTAFLMP